jgi:hypothetical protein
MIRAFAIRTASVLGFFEFGVFVSAPAVGLIRSCVAAVEPCSTGCTLMGPVDIGSRLGITDNAQLSSSFDARIRPKPNGVRDRSRRILVRPAVARHVQWLFPDGGHCRWYRDDSSCRGGSPGFSHRHWFDRGFRGLVAPAPPRRTAAIRSARTRRSDQRVHECAAPPLPLFVCLSQQTYSRFGPRQGARPLFRGV